MKGTRAAVHPASVGPARRTVHPSEESADRRPMPGPLPPAAAVLQKADEDSATPAADPDLPSATTPGRARGFFPAANLQYWEPNLYSAPPYSAETIQSPGSHTLSCGVFEPHLPHRHPSLPRNFPHSSPTATPCS